MNQQVIDKVTQIALDTNFANLFALPGMFKVQAAALELSTTKFCKWFDGLGLPIVDNVWVNSVNTSKDKQEIYGYQDAQSLGKWGPLVSRSISIPGFIKNPPYIDGGVAENPCISQWADESLPIFVSQLMMPYRRTPTGRIETLSYSWEFKAFGSYQDAKKQFGNRLTTFYPMINDIDSTDFGLSKEKKTEMIKTAYMETKQQLEFFKISPSDTPVPILMALSGGGIRSIAHIGVIQALMEYGFCPIKWSGTSGGSAFAVLFAGYEKLLSKAA